uniref:Cysteinyl leukotriene receptor 1 n=1 Tax=Magallana gigas TaxID=29159 RepID=K1PNR4_MAGGI
MDTVTNSMNLTNFTTQGHVVYQPSTTMNSYEDIDEIAAYLWKAISPIIFIVGMTGNMIIVVGLKKMNFQRRPPYIFLFVLAIFDMVVLCVGLSQYWVLYTFDYNLRLVGEAGCRISLFVIYWSMQCSSWILVCVVFERFLKIKFPLKYMRFVTIPRCVRVIVIVMVILGGIDMHLLITNGIKFDKNETKCTSLNADYLYYDEYVFIWVDMTFVSILPFLLMISMNAVMVNVLRQSREFRRHSVPNTMTMNRMNRFDKRLTTMLLVTSIYFLFTTLLISIYYIVDTYNNGSSRSANRASVYSVDITEASIGSEPEPEPEQITNINGGDSHNSGSKETIVGNDDRMVSTVTESGKWVPKVVSSSPGRGRGGALMWW